MKKITHTEVDRVLALRLKEIRQRLQLTEEEAAHRAGVSVRSWRKWEATTVSMRTDSFLKIGRAFKVSLDWLSGFDLLEEQSAA